jgi:hypothetical protein
MNLRLYENNNLYIRVINRTSILITYIIRFTIKIIEINYDVNAFIILKNVLYFILFNRP